MSQPGIGFMLNQVFTDAKAARKGADDILAKHKDKVIKSIKIDNDANSGDGELQIKFDDGTFIHLFDNAHSCCESRYLHTDDDLDYYIGSKFVGIDVKENKEESGDYEVKESTWLNLITSKGVITVVAYNEHNGYYGGISLTIYDEVNTKEN